MWNDGSPRAWGVSVNVIALAPLAATRSVSATVASMSQNGTRTSGIWRSGCRRAPLVDHPVVVGGHAGGGQLLVGRGVKNVLPANPGKLGKHSWAWTPSMSMSSTPRLDVVAARAACRGS